MGFFKKIAANELFKVTSLNSISVMVKIGIGFISAKIIAIFVGPTGMALVGNLRNFLSSVESVGTLGFQNGIVKYVAENESDDARLKKLLSTILICLLLVALCLSGFLYFSSDYLNTVIFGDVFKYRAIFKFFAISLPWYMASLFLIAVMNGLGEYKKVIMVTIYGNVIGLLLSFFLIYYYHTFGALLAVVLAPSMLFLISAGLIKKRLLTGTFFSWDSFDFSVLKLLSEYSLMALVSSVFGPLVLLRIRNQVIGHLGYDAAGYWEGMTRISSYYLLFLSTVLTVYFLPKLSKATTHSETKAIFWSYYKRIFPVFVFGLALLFCLKDFLVPIIFTKVFSPVSGLFFWQLVGDVFKALSLVLGYQFFAKKLTKAFIISEICSLGVLYCTSVYFITIFGIQGIVMAHALTYFIYFVVLTVYFRKSIF